MWYHIKQNQLTVAGGSAFFAHRTHTDTDTNSGQEKCLKSPVHQYYSCAAYSIDSIDQ